MAGVKGKSGGKREGAGRKPSGLRKRDTPHRRRPELSMRHPVHVVLRTDYLCGLRRAAIYVRMRRVLQRYLGREDFRVVHISIQREHLHLIVEARDREALTRGMQSLAINAARAINGESGRCGKVFKWRYHATQITTARQARNTLSYVLNNWRHHRADFDCPAATKETFDPYSSAASFAGWDERFRGWPGVEPLPVSQPGTDLLRTRWQLHGRISPWEQPGPHWR